MLYESGRDLTPTARRTFTPISLRVRVIFGPIFLRVAQSLYRHKIHSTLKDLDIGPTLTWMFFWTLFPPPNELVCMLLWRMCIVVTSTMLFPLTLVLLSLLVRPFLKYRLTNYISCFPPTICFACESRCKPSKFSNFVLIFNTPILHTQKKGLSHISCDICLFGRITIVNRKTRQTKMNTNPKKRTHFPTYWRHKVCPLLLLFLWVCMCNDYNKNNIIWNAWKKSSRCHYKLFI